MKIIDVYSLALPEIKAIRFQRFGDSRGYFAETFREEEFQKREDLPFLKGTRFFQTNESFSQPGVVRGLHFQWNPYMGKLIRTIRGRMLDLILDIRKESPTWGKIIAHDMPSASRDSHGEWIFIPPGFAHGNIFLEESTIEYFCTGWWNPACEANISPFDQSLDWTLCAPAIRQMAFDIMNHSPCVSEKDKCGLSLKDWSQSSRSDVFVFGKCERPV